MDGFVLDRRGLELSTFHYYDSTIERLLVGQHPGLAPGPLSLYHASDGPPMRLRVKLSTLADRILEVIHMVEAFVHRVRYQPIDSKTRNRLRLYIWSITQALSELEELEGAGPLITKHARAILDAKYTAALFMNDIDYHLARDIPISGTKALEECHDGYTRLLGSTHPITIKVSDRLGLKYIDDHEFGKAEAIIKSNLELQGATVSPSLARWYAQQGRNEEAAELYQQVLVEPNDRACASIDQLTNILWCARTDMHCGELARAERLFLKVLQVARPEPQQDRIKAAALEMLADIYWDWSRRLEAQDMQLKSFNLCETVYGCEDARTLHVGHELDRYYFSNAEWAKCESLYTTLITRYEIVHGPENLHTNQLRHCHSHTL